MESNSTRPCPLPQSFHDHPYRENVTDYGDENPLLMDYHRFDTECYTIRFSSCSDAALSWRAVHLF
ncbi:hypothetical protein V8E53_013694 [Lactarius tabidus]